MSGSAPDAHISARGFSVIAVGASAGGVEALAALCRRIDGALDVPMVVVLHVSPTGVSVLPEILARAAGVEVTHVVDGEALRPGAIHVCPPDHHLLVEGSTLRLSQGDREQGHRPAIDPLFRSVAATHATGAVGIVLSGMLSDGARGLLCLHEAGATTIAQDPGEAAFASMPRAAIAAGGATHVLTIDEMADLLSGRASVRPVPDDR